VIIIESKGDKEEGTEAVCHSGTILKVEDVFNASVKTLAEQIEIEKVVYQVREKKLRGRSGVRYVEEYPIIERHMARAKK